MLKHRLTYFLLIWVMICPKIAESQKLFKDFYPGELSSNAYLIGSTDTALIMALDDEEHGYELWYLSLNGVSQPYMIKELTEGQTYVYFQPDSYFDGQYWWITKVNYINGTNYYDLIITDGTESGTKVLNSTIRSALSKQNNQIIKYKDKVYFTALDSTGFNMWVSDGTAQGTKRFIDLDTSNINGSAPYRLNVMNDQLYFVAYTQKYGYELWTSDGTVEGTHMVKDLFPGTGSGIYGIDYFINRKTNKMYFAGQSNIETGMELYVSDGTEAGTVLFKDLDTRVNYSSNPRVFPMNDTSFFINYNLDNEYIIALSDGTLQGTKTLEVNTALKNIYMIQDVSRKNDTYIINAYSIEFGSELWRFEAPYTKLNLVMDIEPGQTNGVNSPLIWLNNKAYFYGINFQIGTGLWQTDGTFENTRPYLVLDNPNYINSVVKYKDKILIFGLLNYAYGQEIYIVDNLSSLNSENKQSYTLYPNPVHHGQSIHIPNLPVEYHLILRDLYGKIIWQGNDINSFVVGENWSTGAYYLSIQSSEQSYTIQLLLN